MTNSTHPLPVKENQRKKIDLGFIRIPHALLPIIEKVFLLAILALAIHYFFPKIASFEETIFIFRSLKLWAVLLAVAAQLLKAWYGGYTLKECVNISGKRITTLQATLIALASYSFGLVAGGMVGGTATTYRWVIVSGGNREGASLGSIIPSIFLSFVFTAVSLIGMVFLLTINNLTNFQAVSFTLISVFLAIIAIALVLIVKYQDRAIEILVAICSALYRAFKKELPREKFTRELNRLFSAWNSMANDGWKNPVIGSFLIVAFDILTVFSLFWAAGIFPSPLVVLTGYGLPNLFGRMAFMIPGGVGLIESTMVAMYNGLGIENSVTTVVVLTYRFLSFWLPSLIGFFLLPYFNRLTDNHYKDIAES